MYICPTASARLEFRCRCAYNMTGSRKPNKHRGPRRTDRAQAKKYYNARDQATKAQRINLATARDEIHRLAAELTTQQQNLVERARAMARETPLVCRTCTQRQYPSCRCMVEQFMHADATSVEDSDESTGYLGGEDFTIVDPGMAEDGHEQGGPVMSSRAADTAIAGITPQSAPGEEVQTNEAAVALTDTPAETAASTSQAEKRSRRWLPTLF